MWSALFCKPKDRMIEPYPYEISSYMELLQYRIRAVKILFNKGLFSTSLKNGFTVGH
jgi:hypothetical protein